MKCRYCTAEVNQLFVDLFHAPPSNAFLNLDQLDRVEKYYPLRVYVCEECYLVQIDEYVNSTEIFTDEYVYYSSFSKSWLNHAEQYVNMIVDRLNLNSNNKVLEIASNDGYLLQYFVKKKIPVLGIDPTKNTAKIAHEKGIDTIVEFFSTKLANELRDKNYSADLIIGNNVLAHVPNINDFVNGMKLILSENGVVTMEFPHLAKLIKYNQFDTIYHEHFSYLSLSTVSKIFESHGLYIFDVEEISTHGGSLRIFARHISEKERTVSLQVTQLLVEEIIDGVANMEIFQKFQESCISIKVKFLEFLCSAKKNGKRVVGYGAAAKGNTLLNYCGIKSDLIKFVCDSNPNKQNLFLPGSHIPVEAESAIQIFKPDFVIIFPWNLSTEICNQLNYIRNWGGKFVTVIPDIKIF